jgi:Coenzyme PQQ synthesis protein D (PqqD)
MTTERPRQRQDLSTRTVDDETIILDRATNQVHQLNTTASFVWQRCDGRHTSLDVADELRAAFDVDAATASEAVGEALRRFAELGLLDAARD